MSSRLIRLALTLWTVALVAFGWGQGPDPAKWTATLEPAEPRPGARAEIVLHANLDKGWHLYSLTPIEDGPFPTAVSAKSGGAVAEVGKPTQAEPEKKLDKNFGKEVEFYEGSAEFRIPVRISKTARGAAKAVAEVRYQVCNDTSCMPPVPKTVEATFTVAGAPVDDTAPLNGPAASVAPASSSPAQWTATLEPAKPQPGARAELVLRAAIGKGWHLYSLTPVADGPFPTALTLKAGGAIAEVGKPTQGEPEKKFDKNFGKEVEFYENAAEFRIPVRIAKSASGEAKASAEVRYQVCNDTSCMPPVPQMVEASFTAAGAPVDDRTPLDAPAAGKTATPGSAATPAAASDADRAKSQGLLAYLGVAVGAGFLALLTPCVFPMIPITVSFFSKRKGEDGMRGTLKQAVAYCVGIIGTFTGLGVLVAAVFGATGLQTLANNPWLNVVLAVVFVALAFSLFGFFEIGVPSSVLTKLDSSGKTGLLGPILMGLTFSLTSFTCTLPFVGGVLVAASQGEFLWPIVGMLGFSTAFCVPFFLLALFPAALSKLPRSGAWLATVKAFMGFVELAAAMKFISTVDLGIVPNGLGIVTREVFLAVWFGVALLAAMYLLGIVRLPHVDDGKIGLFRRAVGVATFLGAGYLLLGINGRSLGEIEAFMPPSDYGKGKGEAKADGWLTNYDQALAQAKSQGKPLFIDFTGYYCTNCRWMEKNMFPKTDVAQRLDGFVRVKLFTDRGTPEDNKNQDLLKKLTNSVTLPAYAAYDKNGTVKTTEFTREESAFVSFLDGGLRASR